MKAAGLILILIIVSGLFFLAGVASRTDAPAPGRYTFQHTPETSIPSCTWCILDTATGTLYFTDLVGGKIAVRRTVPLPPAATRPSQKGETYPPIPAMSYEEAAKFLRRSGTP